MKVMHSFYPLAFFHGGAVNPGNEKHGKISKFSYYGSEKPCRGVVIITENMNTPLPQHSLLNTQN